MLKPSDLTISEFNFFTFYSHKDNEPIDNGLHVHDEYELFFLLEGEMTYEIDGKTVRPNPVQITVIPPNTQHRFLSDSNDEKKILLRGIMIHFSLKENASPAFFEDMFSTLFITNVPRDHRFDAQYSAVQLHIFQRRIRVLAKRLTLSVVIAFIQIFDFHGRRRKKYEFFNGARICLHQPTYYRRTFARLYCQTFQIQ